MGNMVNSAVTTCGPGRCWRCQGERFIRCVVVWALHCPPETKYSVECKLHFKNFFNFSFKKGSSGDCKVLCWKSLARGQSGKWGWWLENLGHRDQCGGSTRKEGNEELCQRREHLLSNPKAQSQRRARYQCAKEWLQLQKNQNNNNKQASKQTKPSKAQRNEETFSELLLTTMERPRLPKGWLPRRPLACRAVGPHETQ